MTHTLIEKVWVLYNKPKMFVRSFVWGSSPPNTNWWKQIEPRFLHQDGDASLGNVNNKDSTMIDLIEAA